MTANPGIGRPRRESGRRVRSFDRIVRPTTNRDWRPVRGAPVRRPARADIANTTLNSTP